MYERAVELLEADLGDELLTLDAKAGQCFGFNSVAASVWRRLAEPAAFDDIRQTLLDEYEVTDEQCTEELRGLMQVLVDQGLVRQAASAKASLEGAERFD